MSTIDCGFQHQNKLIFYVNVSFTVLCFSSSECRGPGCYSVI